MPVATKLPTTVGVRDLKNNLSSFLERVKDGEEITVTEHGRAIARLNPIRSDASGIAALVEQGVIQLAPNPTRRLPAKRVKLVGGASHLSDLVAEQRG
jgi:prevent-host-death family protein